MKFIFYKKLTIFAISACFICQAVFVPYKSSAVTENLIPNADFSKGLEEYINSNSDYNNNVEIVSSAKDNDDITFTGNAAYLPGRRDNTFESSVITTKAISLEPGMYIWQFYVNIISTLKSDEVENYYFGVFTELYNNKRGYGSNSSIGQSIDSSFVSNSAYGSNNGYIVQIYGTGMHSGTLAIKFEISKQTTVYLSTGICDEGDTSRVYISNMFMRKINNSSLNIINGDFEAGNLYGYIYSYANNYPNRQDTLKVIEDGDNSKLYIPPRNNSLGGAFRIRSRLFSRYRII